MLPSHLCFVTFFGILQRLYNIFSSSVQRWSILQSHVWITVKNLSTTRWECRIDSVKALYHQLPEMVEALTALGEHAAEKKDGETLSVAQNLCKELKSWRFVLCLVIWYNILYRINRISKLLQGPKMSIDVLKWETENVKHFLHEYRDGGFSSAQTDAREIAEKMEIDMILEVRAAVHVFPNHISTPDEILNYIYRENLLELHGNLSIALHLLLTLPITVASAERSFSTLKQIKTYL